MAIHAISQDHIFDYLSLITDSFEVNGVWDDNEEDTYISIPLSKKATPATQVGYLTRSGRPSRDPTLGSDPVNKTPVTTPNGEANTTKECPIVKQLQNTKANVTVWQLLTISLEHRQALLEELAKLTIAGDATPENMISSIIPTKAKLTNPVSFPDEDLPPY